MVHPTVKALYKAIFNIFSRQKELKPGVKRLGCEQRFGNPFRSFRCVLTLPQHSITRARPGRSPWLTAPWNWLRNEGKAFRTTSCPDNIWLCTVELICSTHITRNPDVWELDTDSWWLESDPNKMECGGENKCDGPQNQIGNRLAHTNSDMKPGN